MDEIKKYYAGIAVDKTSVIEQFETPEELNNYVPTLRKELMVSERFSRGITAASNVQKRVFVFTFIQDAEITAKYYLIGICIINGSPLYRDQNNHKYECLCARLAELTWSHEDGLSVKELKGGEYCKEFFDFITIHQGLLDKLYEAFDINKDDMHGKDLLTQQLYQYLCKRSVRQIIPIKVKTLNGTDSRFFLSGMMVHSGRSKPGIEDMPQTLPFIQYAALEHAVMDCKYSLVELLDHARYEQ